MFKKNKKPDYRNVGSALTTGHWTQVRSNPPTYFPNGVAADHSTDHSDGMWVRTGDTKGTRFFIPVRGDLPVAREELVAEALAAREPEFAKEQDRNNPIGRSVDSVGNMFGKLTGSGN